MQRDILPVLNYVHYVTFQKEGKNFYMSLDRRNFPAGKKKAGAFLARLIPEVREIVTGGEIPSVTSIAQKTRSPFKVLISTVISARTKDEVTAESSRRLFSLADSPGEMVSLSEKVIAKAIYPAGFYNIKAKSIKKLSRQLLREFNSRVPDTLEELLRLPGVGRKTANLVIARGFGKPAICVDTHVHRIVNRLGLIKTDNPSQTEYALREILDRKYWIEINDLFVIFGRTVCRPVSPFCSICGITDLCKRKGVGRSR
ncbi:MAG TPA: endonuclease III [Candidatus Krumholzibacteriaceae bacterium]|nr:endonuclease III [Candidatus Krumholzibacteriaceae bacterium]